MLTYLINTTSDLFTVCLVLGVTFAYVEVFFTEQGRRIPLAGLAAGLIIAGIRSYITNTRRLVGGWKVGVYGYIAALLFFALLIVTFILFHKRKGVSRFTDDQESRPCLAERIHGSVLALLIASYLYCAVPNVYVYPFKFDTGGEGILSTEYLFRLGGYLLGILVCLLAAVSAYKIMITASKKGFNKLLVVTFAAVNCVYIVYLFAMLMLVLTPRKIVDNLALFNFAAASNNHSAYYSCICFVIILGVGLFLFIKSGTMNEPYATKAEHRKQRAAWRTGRRFTVSLLACFICCILCATLFVKLNTVEIREAPVEDPTIIKDGSGKDSELRVPLEMVNDFHLHRFGYTVEDGTLVRFIVVLKQENTSNYGVGLDACDICGEAGYYENNDGQVVCKKCNVVMNRTTIGMKGGCNPIIIDYDINEDYITVPVEEMTKNADHFSK